MDNNIQVGDKFIAEVVGVFENSPLIALRCGHTIFTTIPDCLPTVYIKKEKEKEE